MGATFVLVFCRWLTGLTFASSVVGKARALGAFRSTIAEFGVLPARLVPGAAIVTVTAEGLVVALVAAGDALAAAGFALALVLLAVFSVVLGAAVRKDTGISCNCFGPSERRVSWYDVARNGLLGLGCAGGLWAWLTSAPGSSSPALIVALGLVAAGAGIVVANLDDLVEMLRKPYLAE
jgi:Methylamine utilisation protein MauE